MTQSWNDPTTPKPAFETGKSAGERSAQEKKDQAAREAAALKDTTAEQGEQVKQTAAENAAAVKDTAAEQAGQLKETAAAHAAALKDTAADATAQVADTAKVEASQVVGEARDQVRGLVDSTVGELRSRAADAQLMASGTLEGLSDELVRISRGETTTGPVNQLVGDLAQRSSSLTTWLQSHEPDDVVVEVRRFAARRPVAFLALAAGAGLVAGRLARGTREAVADEQQAAARRTPVTPVQYGTQQAQYATPQAQYGTPQTQYVAPQRAEAQDGQHLAASRPVEYPEPGTSSQFATREPQVFQYDSERDPRHNPLDGTR